MTAEENNDVGNASEERSLPADCMGKNILIHVGLDSSLDDQGLQKINCFINKTCGLRVCRSCQVDVSHLRCSLVTKHDLYRSAEEPESILRSHPVMSLKDATDFVRYTDTLP